MSACGPSPADLVVVGGSVWTADRDAPWVSGFAVVGDSIVRVGTEDHVRELIGERTRVVELDGRFAMPGFIDTHTHFVDGGFRLSTVDLRDADTPAEFARRLGEYASELDAGEWILGGDWDHELWGGELPDRSWIDSVTPHNPVFVTRLDWHMALANSLALDVAGVTGDVSEPPGGEVVRDATGRLTGVLKDDAMQLVQGHIPSPSTAQRDSALQAAMRHAAALGVTSVTDMGSWEDLETYQRARDASGLTLRVYAYVPLSTVDSLQKRVAAAGTGDEWLRIGGLKGFVDGSLGSGTALFSEPYSDEPDNFGLMVTPLEDLAEWTRSADRAGLQVAIHAIGDRAIAQLLDLYASLEREHGARDRRYRIEHAQPLAPTDVSRFSRLGVTAAMQPYHAIDDGRWAERRIGPGRAGLTYAFRSLLDEDAPLAFGSDWTVAPLDPLLGVYAAVTRRTLDGENPGGWVPEQRIDVDEALRAYTESAARAGFMETRVGRLRAGMLADFVVLSGNPFDVPPEAIRELRVEHTFVGGREVFPSAD